MPQHPRRVLAAGLGVGVTFDALMRVSGADSAAMTLWVVASVLAMSWAADVRQRSARCILAGAAAFAPWFAVRTSPWLLIPNALVIIGLVSYAGDIAAGGRLRRGFAGLCAALWASVVAVVEVVPFLGAMVKGLRSNGASRVPWRSIARSLSIAIPVVVVLGALLAAGDAVFASVFDVGGNLGDLLGHGGLIVLGALLFGMLAVIATPPTRTTDRTSPWQLGGTETIVLLASVAALFALYAAVQLGVAIAGEDYVLQRTGLTYAEYARSGFFQLSAAIAITLVMLCVLRSSMHAVTRHRRLLVGLVVAVVLLSQVLVFGSIVRIRLYSDVFGLTHLRLYTVIAAAWMGALIVLAGVAGVRRHANEWVALTGCGLAALIVFAMNVVNPDAMVARENLGRADSGRARFDEAYLRGLSDDAVPVMVERFNQVPAAHQEGFRQALCSRRVERNGPFDANLAARAAEQALDEFCG